MTHNFKVSPVYSGKFEKHQQEGHSINGKKFSVKEINSLNDYQIFLYNRALYGLSVYSQEDINLMHWEKRKRINKVNKRAKAVINLWKQQLTNTISTSFFKAIFPGTEFTKHFEETTNETDINFTNNISFKSLGISKNSIVDKLINEGVLPINFYNLNTENLCK